MIMLVVMVYRQPFLERKKFTAGSTNHESYWIRVTRKNRENAEEDEDDEIAVIKYDCPLRIFNFYYD